MHSRRFARLAVIATVAVPAIAFTIFWPRFRDSRSRVEHEHGLHLPASASAFECRGDAARGFLDRGAASAFVMSTNDLPLFVSQLKVHPGHATFIPSNSQYHLHVPWRKLRPTTTYSCNSPVGDWLHVEVWPVNDTQVGICLYTDWN